MTPGRPSCYVSSALLNAQLKKAESGDCAQQLLLTDAHRGSVLPLREGGREGDSSAGQRADGKVQILFLGNSHASKFGCDLKRRSHW